MGEGLSFLFDIIVIRKDENYSTIVFKNKSEKPINPMEFFSFGIIIGRDYQDMNKERSKRKINIELTFENDKFPTTKDTKELEYSLLSTLKDALNEDRLIVQDVKIKSHLEIDFETIIIT
ncbi:hypothetical protein [Chryseobacterium herbae]|uniref:Uncharacterized protein n=1 Tax=Chryseobacterium herbae TaxID=2976476 RepID=A0ABT2IZP5_9FLAO|nr:hypothetical protein [Chryseobacterium sp. pc1-10]MCT2563966.1 hypothetical protein [Chryseobacterium sp. pc1-10]